MPETPTYTETTTGYCDDCGRRTTVGQEIEQHLNDDGIVDDEWVIRSLCYDCAQN